MNSARRTSLHFLVLVAAITAFAFALPGCPNEPPLPPVKQPPVLVDPPPMLPAARTDGRLPPLATPTHYTIDFNIDPTLDRFSGVVRIEVDIPQKTSFIVLHGHNLTITSARADLLPPHPPVPARASTRMAQGGKTPEELVLAFGTVLPVGHASLVLEWNAPFDDELSGIYRVKDGESWYAFSQFESTDARRAFPCFDEPAFKVPFDVTVTVPRGLLAVANSPETSHEEMGSAPKTRFRFAPTPPLPSYLVAVAVGDFDVKEATRYTRPPLRIITTKGKTQNGVLGLEATSGLVDALGDWFAIPYPYAKLDIVAVPEFAAGAMENPGLITFREERLLLDPARASVVARRAQAVVIAHELAHQWFGDLVTASWWNDIWLNEGMATWMETRIVDKWRPQLGAGTDAIVSAHNIMDVDGLITARAVRQPVVSTSDANEAFDGITYEKGAAVLSTIEKWIGEDNFQRGVREYLKDNSWKSVQADRLFAALDKASGKDVTQMASGYVDQAGVAEVSGHLECDQGARWHMELASMQWRPLGSKLPDESMRSWTIPTCVRVQGEKKDTCSDLVAGAPSLLAGRGCPTFVHPNASSGYYRFVLSEKEMIRLAESRRELDVPMRITFLSDTWAGVRSGALEPKALLKILPAFDDDNTRQVVDQVIAILFGMNDLLGDDDVRPRPAFRRFALARMAKRKKTLGFLPPAKGDASSDDTLMRRSVIATMGDVIEDDATLKEADDIAMKWLADPTSVDSDTAAIAVDLASRRAGDARLAALQATTKTAKAREDRILALRSMYGFDDEARFKAALDFSLTDEVKTNEMRYVLASAFARRKMRPAAEAWVRAHWDDLRKKLPGGLSTALLRAASAGCSTTDIDERTQFYTPRVAGIEGAARGLAESLEAVSLCATLREKATPNLRKALLPPTSTK